METTKSTIRRGIELGIGLLIVYLSYLALSDFAGTFSGTWTVSKRMLILLMPFIFGLTFAYLLNPVVVWFEKRLHGGRILSLLLSIPVVVIIIGAIYYTVHFIALGTLQKFAFQSLLNQLMVFINDYAGQFLGGGRVGDSSELYAVGTDWINNYVELATGILSDQLRDTFGELSAFGKSVLVVFSGLLLNLFRNSAIFSGESIQVLIQELIRSFTLAVYTVFSLMIGAVMAVHFILKKEHYGKRVENTLRFILIEESRIRVFKDIMKEFSDIVQKFLFRSTIELTVLGFITFLVFAILRFDYALFIGLFAGYATIIPFLGPMIGIIPAIIIGIITGGWQRALLAVLCIWVIRFLYFRFISPRINQNRLRLHPIMTLLSMLVFWRLFGIIGLILAMPLACILKVIVLRVIRYRVTKRNIKFIE